MKMRTCFNHHNFSHKMHIFILCTLINEILIQRNIKNILKSIIFSNRLAFLHSYIIVPKTAKNSRAVYSKCLPNSWQISIRTYNCFNKKNQYH